VSPRSTAAAGPEASSLADIAADRRGGAAEVAERLLAWGEAWGEGAPGAPDDVTASLVELARAQAALAPVLRIANDYLDALERLGGMAETSQRRVVGNAAHRWRERLALAGEALTLHVRRALAGASTVYTYSASSTIERALEAHAAAGHWFRVVVSEASPGREGVALAISLAERGVRVRLGTDAWLMGSLEDEGVVLVGADALLPARWVNKLGTRLLADRGRARGLRVVVAADTSKWLPAALAALPRSYERDPAELVAEPAPAALEVVNPYFEEIPYSELDVLVTERGPTRPKDLGTGDISVAKALL
jgi:translation initiation factor 2B subunit (eIF-2B alpha/beta/delta family)